MHLTVVYALRGLIYSHRGLNLWLAIHAN